METSDILGTKAAASAKHRLIYLLTLAQRRVQNSLRAEKGDATAAQAGVLFLLGSKDGTLVSDVARGLGMGLPGASGLVDRMVGAGLVEKRQDETDGRASRLFLTAQGAQARAIARTAAAEINARLVEGFTDRELDVIARWLRHVSTTFGKKDIEP